MSCWWQPFSLPEEGWRNPYEYFPNRAIFYAPVTLSGESPLKYFQAALDSLGIHYHEMGAEDMAQHTVLSSADEHEISEGLLISSAADVSFCRKIAERYPTIKSLFLADE